MFLLNDEAAVDIAKELTIVAMSNGMIAESTNSIETAKLVNDFYKTVFDFLTIDGNN